MKLFSEAMDELLEVCEAQEAPKVVASSIAALIAHDERKLFCWVGNSDSATRTDRDLPGLYASDLLEKLLATAIALDWELVVVLVHEALSSPVSVAITPEMIEAGAEIVFEAARDVYEAWYSPAETARRVFVAMLERHDTSCRDAFQTLALAAHRL